MPTEYFNKKWMTNLNPELLHRFWLSKGIDKILRINSPYGTQWDCYMSPHGEIRLLTEVLNNLNKRKVDD